MNRKILFLLALSILGLLQSAHGQGFCPSNVDFEDSALTNWNFWRGENLNTGTTAYWTLASCAPISTLHTLTYGTGTDTYGGFPVVAPWGGRYSLKLGKDSTNNNADGASYYMHVPSGSSTYSLVYMYAMVLENPTGHTAAEQPRMAIFAIDSATHDTLACASYNYVSASTDPGFTEEGTSDVYYKNWTEGNMKFLGEDGRTVTVSVIVGGCTLGGHFGYGYFDMSCGSYAVSVLSCGSTTESLTAPGGYTAYKWTDSLTYTASYGTTQTVSITVPTVATTYAVILTPYTGYGCTDTLYTHVVPSDLVVSPSHDTSICRGASATLNAGATDISLPLTYSWVPSASLSCATCSSPVATPSVTTLYSVTVTDAGGCLQTDTVRVTVYANPVTITGPFSVCTGASTILTDTSSGGHWSSSSTSTATIGTTGLTSGIAVGTTTISFTIGGICYTTRTETVYPTPTAIIGTPIVCPGTTASLTDITSGGTWISSNAIIATVGSGTGLVTGVVTGSALITYELTATTCFVTSEATVNPLPLSITGVTTFCQSTNSSLYDATSGGHWSSGNTAIATVGTGTGIAYGVAAGTTYVTYTLNTGCQITALLDIEPLPGAIFGTEQVCPGYNTTLGDATSGGSWSSAATTVATISSSTGVATGVIAGTTLITYTISPSGCYSLATLTVNPDPDLISGVTTICVGLTSLLSDVDTGGVWTSSNVTDAGVGSLSGLVTGNASGVANIDYTLATGCYDSVVVDVYPNPTAIGGTTTLCVGTSSTLTDAMGGGTWLSGNTSVANVITTLGSVTGVSAGTAVITYTASTGCWITTTVTVIPTPLAINGPTSLCVGTVDTLTDLVLGGSWTTSSGTIATIGSGTGYISGIAPGTVTVTYGLGGTCRATRVETVYATPAAIGGSGSICIGTTATLTDGTSGGTWSSALITIGTVSTSGVVTGVSAGTVVISYRLSDGCSSRYTVTVNPSPTIISGTLSACVGGMSTLDDGVTTGTWSGGGTIATVGSLTGDVTGLTAGTTMITYMVGTCKTSSEFVVHPLPSGITGTMSICAGTSTTLTDGTSGGTWISSNTLVATVGSVSGIVAGIGAGTTIETYQLATGCLVTTTVTVYPAPAVIGGVGNICSGTTTTYTDGTVSGVWTSGNISVATIGSLSGSISGVGSGSSIITYTIGTCSATKTLTVYASPGYPRGPTALCIGATVTLSDSVTGGTWLSTSTSVATIGSASGLLHGLILGTSIVSYTAPGGCFVVDTITVSPTPTTITGIDPVCLGYSVPYSDTVSGGLWTSSDYSIAEIGSSTGLLTGAGVGATIITYSLGSGCTTYKTVTVIPSPAAISGTTGICVGTSTGFTETTGGGVWQSSNVSVGTVNTSGIAYGISSGTTIISYVLPSGCAATVILTVDPTPSSITGTATLCSGATTSLIDLVSGGIWSTSNSSVATVGSTGVVTGVAGGTALISYFLGGVCGVERAVTVYQSPSVIGGGSAVCIGAAISLTDSITGGTWSSGTVSVGTIGVLSGALTGLSLGSTVITYTTPGGCYQTLTVAVSPTPTAVMGSVPVCVGSEMTLTDGVTSGLWTTSNPGICSVGSASGMVTGVSAGTAYITYSLGSGCIATAVVTVTGVPAAIGGPASVCAGANITETDITPSGLWSSVGSLLSIGAGTGNISSVTAGTQTISYTIGDGCYVTRTITVNPLPAAIIGTPTVCIGSTTLLSDPSSGTWASSTTSVATIGLTTGVVTGISAGTSIISTFVSTGCYTTIVVTVDPTPSSILGTVSLCAGSTSNLGDLVSGGSWSSSNATTAVIGSSTGILTAVATGSAIITYMLPAGCYITTVASVKPSPSLIAGSSNMCVLTTTTYADTITGGVWSSSITAVATINSSTGLIDGVSTGTSMITYELSSGCYVTKMIDVNPTATPISAPLHLCSGSCYTLTDAVGGGTWSSTMGTVATIDVTTGLFCGVTAGTTTISYIIGAGCYTSSTFTVNQPPLSILGGTSVCEGNATSLSDLSTPGTWFSSNTAVATVSTSGLVTGVTGGNSFITYTITDGCTAIADITVNPIGPVSGLPSVCQYSSITMTDTSMGGTWASSNASVGTVDASLGIVTGVGSGSFICSYTMPTGCFATKAITVNAVPDLIGGTEDVCVGLTTSLSDPTGLGTWSSSATAVATINTGTGVVTGITAGTTIVTYKLSTGCYVDAVITVNSLPMPITSTGNVCSGSMLTLSDPVPGGSWSTTGAGTIGSVSGVLTGVGTGSSVVTYTLGSGCTVTTTVVVNPTPVAISGVTHICLGQSTSLTDTYGGGTWSSSAPTVAPISSLTGIINGLDTGVALISYSLTTGCRATMAFTVIPIPSAVVGDSAICAGQVTSFSDVTTGGTWNTSDPTIATIDTTTGVATGLSSGVALVSYTLGSGCMAIGSVLVSPVSPINGPATVCPAQSIELSDTTEGGTWGSSSTLFATVTYSGDTTGLVTGVSAGGVLISYTLPSGCVATKIVVVNPAPLPISGPAGVCNGQQVTLEDFTPLGTWASSHTAIATINTTTGVVMGMSPGVDTIVYQTGGCPAFLSFTVNPDPAAIAGNPSVCLATGSTTILADFTPGGSWYSGTTSIATIGLTTGVVSGVSLGTAIVSYQLPFTGCYSSVTVQVNPIPPAIVPATPVVCTGTQVTLHDVPGGVWSSTNTSVGAVNAVSGVLTGVSAGTAIISYTTGSGCATAATAVVLNNPHPIVGSPNACISEPDLLSDVDLGGIWVSSSTGVAVVGSLTGVVTGVTIGPAVISYVLGSGCQATTSVVVNPLPTPIVGTAQLCVGLTTNLTDFTSGGTWSAVSVIASVGEYSGIVTGESGGTALVSYILPTGCYSDVSVQVFPYPTSVSGNLTVCLGASNTLGDGVSGGSWYSLNTDVATIGVTSGVVHGDSLGTTPIVYTLGPGCSVQTTATVVPLPSVYSIIGGGSFCNGGTGVDLLLDSSDGGTNYLLYRGSTATGAFSGTGRAVDFGLQTIGGTYTVVAINTTTGCTNEMRGADTVTVIPTIVPAVTISGSGPDTVCSGTSVTYTALPTNGGLTPSYQWYVNGVNVGVGAAYTYVPAVADLIQVTLHSDVRCPLPDTATTAITAHVLDKQVPAVNFTVNPGDTICKGMAATFTADPIYGGSAPTYAWHINSVIAGTGSVYSYTPANGDTVICYMNSNFPCLYTNDVQSHELVVLVDTPLIPSVIISANPGSVIGIGKTVTLTANVVDGGIYPTYQWYINGNPVPAATSQTFTSNNFDSTFEDSVSVTVTSSGICPMTAHNWIYIEESDVAVNNVAPMFADVQVMPNPNNGEFTIVGSIGNLDQDVTIIINDMLGQVVYKNVVRAVHGNINAAISLGNNVANGNYLLNMKSDTDNEVYHLVISH